MKKIIGGVITLAIGGMVFTVNQADIVKNFSKETGLSQTESQKYVENVSKDDLVSYDKLGSGLISDGQSIVSTASGIDCVNYNYTWETKSLPCTKGKAQLISLGNDEIALGKGYTTLASDSATKNDMSSVISLIDRINVDLSLEIVSSILDAKTINDSRKTNSYNKALLQSALESNK